MIYSYVKIAWRQLLHNKVLSLINILGLALGITFALLIGMWIQHERSFDTFTPNRDRIALVGRHLLLNNTKGTAFSVMLPLYDELKSKYPEINRASRYGWANMHSLVRDDRKVNKQGVYVDPDFLTMFSLPIIQGNLAMALQDPNSIVLTQSLAQSLFGDANPLGKILNLDGRYPVQVTAVVADVPKNATLTFDFLAPFAFQVQHNPEVRGSINRWNNNFLGTLVELKEGTSMEAVSRKISPLLLDKETGTKNQTLFLYPMTHWHLYDHFENWVNTGGRIEYVRLFGLIGVFVLLIGCINFMNLATARSAKRAKEVGVRKAVGSQRAQLIVQFLTESLLTTFLAFLISLVLMQVILPYGTDLGFEHIRFDFVNPGLWASVLTVCLVTGLMAGSYPAFYLSSFLPVKVLKGGWKPNRGSVSSLRKLLVVTQFTVSVGLIICTFVVFQQINHARNRPIGYDPNNLITLEASQEIVKNFTVLKQDLLNTGLIEAVAKSSGGMTQVSYDYPHFSWAGKDPQSDISLDVVLTEWDYEKAARLEFIAGRPFSREFKTDSNSVILNEAALKLMAYSDPVGKTMKLGDQELTIVGIIKNVLMNDPFKPVSPGVILFNAHQTNTILIRLKEGADLKPTLAAIERIGRNYNAATPITYSFVDEAFGRKFETENQVAKLGSIFAGLAIFISCLGLFGLAMFLVEQRAKEISIRKVLGAGVVSLWLMLSKEFVLLVSVACLLAAPVSYGLMKNWLEKYEYRIEIAWWVFALAGLIGISVALLTVSSQALKAALANPAKRLRAE